MAPRPQVEDLRGILDALRRDGTVHWPNAQLPANFEAWRLALRRAARAADLRVSIRRLERVFFVEHLDHEGTEDDRLATGDVINGIFSGQPISFDDARRARARERLTLVQDKKKADH